eukprot:CAMPEP_0206277050 /NCGR_PEP_ID=MMETSP0047_2-20121206/36649_1 /ASSEMBLY_ACC=CAM_ASM_000192 /TAXON_ID=195065 /ORGANISM="Chroomonas mesostigmatica_cf, Strain CCMP1168" /LENGTH=114 /DNA_ID=CAMNT_0053706641 /DNA_START=135 /DNA_END=479 /DNA_ORIENTATION=+
MPQLADFLQACGTPVSRAHDLASLLDAAADPCTFFVVFIEDIEWVKQYEAWKGRGQPQHLLMVSERVALSCERILDHAPVIARGEYVIQLVEELGSKLGCFLHGRAPEPEESSY